MLLVQVVTRSLGLLVLGLALAAPSAAARGAAAETVLAISGRDYRQLRLVEVDRALLRPTGRSLDARGARAAWSYSADGSRLALASSYLPTTGRPAGILLVDVERVRALARIRVPGSLGSMRALTWVTAERLLALTVDGRGRNLALSIDAVARRSDAQRQIAGIVLDGHVLPSGIVLLVAPRRGIGAARLVTVDAALTVRSVTLPGIRAGWGRSRSAADPAEHRRPGLAVDPAGTRAFVVGADEAPVTVELGTMRATSHPAARLPQARTKSLVGPVRRAEWVADGVLAVTGTQYAGVDPTTRRLVTTPAGLTLLDTRTWRSTRVDEEAEAFQVAGSTVIVGVSGRGLAAYAPDGRQLWTALAGRRFNQLGVLDGRAFVQVNGERGIRILDVRTGRELARRDGTVPRLLAARSSAFP